MSVKLFKGNCPELMKQIDGKSIDMFAGIEVNNVH